MSLYTTPVKVNVQAKKMIETFEKGEIPAAVDGDPEVVIPTVTVNRELSVEELAQPGTARKLLQVFQQASGEDGQTSPTATSPGLPAEELAQPGTARDLMRKFEIIVQEKEARRSSRLSREISAGPGERLAEQVLNLSTSDQQQQQTEVIACNGHAAISPGDETEADDVAETTAEPCAGDGGVQSPRPCSVNSDPEVSTEVNSEVKEDEEGAKTVLVLYAVRQPTELDSKLLEVTVRQLEAAKNKVSVSNLGELMAPGTEFKAGPERDKMMASDLVVFHVQPGLQGVPAAIHTWLEAVFAPLASGTVNIDFVKSVLGGKKLLVHVTPTIPDFSTNSLAPIQEGFLQRVGFVPLTPQISHVTAEAAKDIDSEEFKAAVQQWTARLDQIWNEGTPADN